MTDKNTSTTGAAAAVATAVNAEQANLGFEFAALGFTMEDVAKIREAGKLRKLYAQRNSDKTMHTVIMALVTKEIDTYSAKADERKQALFEQYAALFNITVEEARKRMEGR